VSDDAAKMETRPRRAWWVLAIGVAAWGVGVGLTPGEIAAAKRREPVSPRTIVALVAYLVGAIGTLQGLAPKKGERGR
jgi:hypothetical protein